MATATRRSSRLVEKVEKAAAATPAVKTELPESVPVSSSASRRQTATTTTKITSVKPMKKRTKRTEAASTDSADAKSTLAAANNTTTVSSKRRSHQPQYQEQDNDEEGEQKPSQRRHVKKIKLCENQEDGTEELEEVQKEETSRKKAKSTRVTRVKKEPTVTTATTVAADAKAAENAKTTKKKISVVASAAAVGKKRRAQQSEGTEHTTVDANGVEAIKPKRARKARKAIKLEETKRQLDTDLSSSSSSQDHDQSEPLPILAPIFVSKPKNRSDPCELFPTEVWQQTLSYLPLSQVAIISVVSKAWLDGSRSFPVWKTICEQHKLGQPKIKYRSHMALVCSRSFWICDDCHSYSTGRGNASDIPLPIARQDDYNNTVWNLCHGCRVRYHRRFPEALREVEDLYEWQENKITKTSACETYHLSEADLYGLVFDERRNPHYRHAAPMRLYNRYAIQKRALRVHGGWVGVDAFTNSICKKRSAAFKVRELGFRVRTKKHSIGGNEHDHDNNNDGEDGYGGEESSQSQKVKNSKVKALSQSLSQQQQQQQMAAPLSTTAPVQVKHEQQSQSVNYIKSEVADVSQDWNYDPDENQEAGPSVGGSNTKKESSVNGVLCLVEAMEPQVKTGLLTALPDNPRSVQIPCSVSSFVPMVPVACE